MYPQNRTGEGRREQALRADDIGSRNTGHEMYRQEGPRQQKGSGRASKCGQGGVEHRGGSEPQRDKKSKPSGEPGDTSQPEAACQGERSRPGGVGASRRTQNRPQEVVTSDQVSGGPNCREAQAGWPGGSDTKDVAQSVIQKKQVGGAQKGRRMLKTDRAAWVVRENRDGTGSVGGPLTHTAGPDDQGFRKRCRVQICT